MTDLTASRPDTPLEAALRAHGIVHPQITNEVSAKVGGTLAAYCAILMMESAGGDNVFGHDPGNPIQGGQVTEDRYKLLRHYIGEGYASNGVGPCQLTSVSLLNEADARGGSWNIEANMTVGFTFLRQLRDEFGEQGGFQHYNGSGPAAVLYGQRAVQWETEFQEIINGVLERAATDGPDPQAGG